MSFVALASKPSLIEENPSHSVSFYSSASLHFTNKVIIPDLIFHFVQFCFTAHISHK